VPADQNVNAGPQTPSGVSGPTSNAAASPGGHS
jgi:hypothetical protein